MEEAPRNRGDAREKAPPVGGKEIRKSTLFGIGGFELFIILLFGFLVFGPDKLPEMAKTLGAALRKFKQAQEEMEQVIKGEVLEADGGASSGKAAASKPAPNASQESFAARKARYDKQRAEREAARRAELEANRRAMREEAAKKAAAAPSPEGAAVGESVASTPAAGEAVGEASAAAARPDGTSAAPELTPDELFGSKPIKPVPGSKAPARAAVTPTDASAVVSAPTAAAAHPDSVAAAPSASGSEKGGE